MEYEGIQKWYGGNNVEVWAFDIGYDSLESEDYGFEKMIKNEDGIFIAHELLDQDTDRPESILYNALEKNDKEAWEANSDLHTGIFRGFGLLSGITTYFYGVTQLINEQEDLENDSEVPEELVPDQSIAANRRDFLKGATSLGFAHYLFGTTALGNMAEEMTETDKEYGWEDRFFPGSRDVVNVCLAKGASLLNQRQDQEVNVIVGSTTVEDVSHYLENPEKLNSRASWYSLGDKEILQKALPQNEG